MLYTYFWYFFIFAFVGWCTEVAFCAVKQGIFVNRGFLNGPVCPIYGVGVTLVAIMLVPVKDNLAVLFIGSVIVTSGIEFLTGFLLEKLFHTKWWDYSDVKFNICGYICLPFSVIWGVCCMAVVKFLLPSIDKLISFIPHQLGLILLIVFAALITVDTAATVAAIIGINRQLKALDTISSALRENSDKIGKLVSDKTVDLVEKYEDSKQKYDDTKQKLMEERKELAARIELQLKKTGVFKRRILSAFPHMKHERYHEALEKLRERLSSHKKSR